MTPLDILFERHRRHYEPGTLETFTNWFGRSGYGDMLNNAFIRGGKGVRRPLDSNALSFAKLGGVSFENRSNELWRIVLTPSVDNADSVRGLFDNFVRCTGHTHPIADFRSHLDYFSWALAGPRFLLFHGAGSCLLLSAMLQALVSRKLGEHIELHYSHSANKEFTHVFATWRGEYFVDPDQKTWAPLKAIDEVPSLGYIFQQFGVAGHLVYGEFSEDERESLFTSMTRDYFDFYDLSVQQYMYQRRLRVAELARLFREARTKFCWPLSIDADDFQWKKDLRQHAAAARIPRPYFLVNTSDAVVMPVPVGGALRIGIGEDALPDEVDLISAIFFGRVPASVSVPLDGRKSQEFEFPEFPWLLVFGAAARSISVNGREVTSRLSRCGRFQLVGMGALERVFDPRTTTGAYSLRIEARGCDLAKVVMPLNAFTLAADLVHCHAPSGAGRTIEGRMAA